MAGETGTTGSGFPVFKSEGGEFDRAKFKKEITASQGRFVDAEAADRMRAADSVIDAAKIFFFESYEKNIKELDPAIDTKSVYYREAYTDTGTPIREIQKKIDSGKALDGKEIFDMSKEAANNKLNNVNVLKTGKVTEIIENIGYNDIKMFDAYDTVKDEFDSKIKDEKFKFDVLAEKFLDVLHYFNEENPTLASQYAPILYTDENRALIAAFAKILQSEGLEGDFVKKAAEQYENYMTKLVEKSKGGTVEDIGKLLPGATAATGATGAVAETKLEEKKVEAPTGPTGPSVTPIESTTPATGEATGAATGAATTVTTTETLTTTTTQSTTGSTGSTGPGKVEGAQGPTTSGTGATGVTSADVKKRQEDLLSSLLGIKFPEASTGGTGGTGTTGGKESKTKEPEKKKEETTLEKKVDENKTGENKGTTQTPSAENKETKLEEKISSNNEVKNETSALNTPIKETETQNLSSVITPEKENTDMDQNKPTGTGGSTTTTTETKTTETKTEGGEGGSTTTTTGEQVKTEDKAASEEKQKSDKEMADNIKSMVTLLTQLNSTLQNPLIVIPNDKKFN